MHFLKDSMNAERWEEVKRVFAAALEQPLAQRSQFVLEACHGDERLVAEIQGLLQADADATSFLGIPALGDAGGPDDGSQPRSVKIWPMGSRVAERFQICGLLGSGGMGRVYRAWDERLQREVAIKTVRTDYSTDPEALARFEREARALAALNHPNLLAVYDIGTQDGVAFIVSELLDGETLRARLEQGTISFHRAVNYAVQIVRGLAAAHEKGLIHRDLKPDNIFLTKDGQVKLLDFGLAKLIQREAPEANSPEQFQTSTLAGRIIGTPGYMSPEQVRGLSVDPRSDIFSFGAILYEVLTRKRAFPGETRADVISATLNNDPEDPCQIAPGIAPAAGLIIRHCLEKRPEDRFQSARDLSFDLEVLPTASTAGHTPFRQSIAMQSATRKPLLWAALAVVIVLALVAGIPWFRSLKPAVPSFTQVSFRRSTIWAARFTKDGNTVVYNASWGGNPINLFSTHLGDTEPRPLERPNTYLLSVSSRGELAVVSIRQEDDPWFHTGTLARTPLGIVAPREIVENVQGADWSPDGADLAIVRQVGGEQQLEFPAGKVLYRIPGWITDVRFSPTGKTIAFMEHGSHGDDRGWVSEVDLDGKQRRLTEEFTSERGLAWAPNGNEIWFSATRLGEPFALYAVTLDGKERVAFRSPANVQLHDIRSDGAVLLSNYRELTSVVGLLPGQGERDLSWLDNTVLSDLSDDGKTFLFQYFGEGSGPNYSSYLGRTDGSPPIRLGEGGARKLSPDGKWAVATLPQTHQTVLLPTGAGPVSVLPRNGIVDNRDDTWTADSKRLVFSGQEPGKPARCYIQDIAGGKPEPVGPPGLTAPLISPDGKLMIALQGQNYVLLRVADNEVQPARGIDPSDRLVRWSGDSRWIYLYRPQRVVRIFEVDPVTGHRELLRQIDPSDPSGMIGFPRVLVSADGKSFVYWFLRRISELYVGHNLLQP